MEELEEKFNQIYDQYIDKIYRYIFLKVNSKDIAEDLTSETFLKYWQALNKKKEENSFLNPIKNNQAFLYEVARNLVIDYYRKKEKTKAVSLTDFSLVDQKSDLEGKSILNSDFEQVQLALNNLKDDYQNVILWYYLENFSIKEIADMLGRTEQATRVLLHRALKSLKKELNSS